MNDTVDMSSVPYGKTATIEQFPSSNEEDDGTKSFLDHFMFDYNSNLFDGSYDNFTGQLNTDYSPPASSTTLVESDQGTPGSSKPDTIEQLTEIECCLIRLRKALSEGEVAAKDVEDLYRANADTMSVLKGLDSSHFSQAKASTTGATPFPNIVWLLLLSACYYSLLRNFELLEGLLCAEIAADSNNQSNNSLQRIQLPNLSVNVGSVEVSMPRKEAVQINLHLLSRMARQLRDAMVQCFGQLDSNQDIGDMQGVNPGALLQKTIADLGESEERLFETLRRKGYN